MLLSVLDDWFSKEYVLHCFSYVQSERASFEPYGYFANQKNSVSLHRFHKKHKCDGEFSDYLLESQLL